MAVGGSIKVFHSMALGGLLALALSQGAAAQVTAEQQSAIKASCRSDFMSKCSGVRPGGAEALQCLQKNVASLSSACQTAVSATLPKPAPAAATAPPPPPPAPAAAAPSAPAAPAPTIQTAKPPAATMPTAKPAAAMPAARAATPPAPAKPAPAPQQAAMPPAADAPPPPTPEQMSAIKNTCRGDFSRNCKGVPLGGPEAIACLQANAAKLSPNCKTALADIADTAAPAAPTAPVTQRPNAPVVMTAVIGRACMRDLIRRCRDTGVGDGQKIACLQANEASLAPLCKAALKGTAPIR